MAIFITVVVINHMTMKSSDFENPMSQPDHVLHKYPPMDIQWFRVEQGRRTRDQREEDKACWALGPCWDWAVCSAATHPAQ